MGFELTLEMETFHGIASPSHSISSRGNRVAIAVSGDVPDRDLVLDVETGRKPFLVTGPAEDGKKHFAGILPSAQFGEITETPRSILVVLDRSGSMEGDPIQQAVAAIKACLALLTADGQIGLITFSDGCTRWKKSLVPATKVNRNDMAWRLGEVRASGGTELGPALAEATKILGPGGEIFLVTDGQVFETAEIVTMAAARGIRVHVLGIGSASQDRFLAQLARQTGGVSRFLTPKERVDEGAAELFAAIGRPVARIEEAETDDGRVLCGVPTAIFSGTPAHLLGTGSGALRLKVDGAWLVWKLDECGAGETIRLLEGARRIADLESREPCDAREAQRLSAALKALSEEYGLASREMALVAVMRREGDVVGEVPKTVVAPVGFTGSGESLGILDTVLAGGRPQIPAGNARRSLFLRSALARRLSFRLGGGEAIEPGLPVEDTGFRLAAMIEPDGGMPGRNDHERIAHSLVAVMFLVQSGSSLNSGPFRAHIARLVEFLEKQDLDEAEWQVLGDLRAGKVEAAAAASLAQRILDGKRISRTEVFATRRA